MIRPINRFTLDTADADRTATSLLLAGGSVIGRVRGSHIDAQFSVDDDGYVLFLSFNNIFSAIETIYFVSSDRRVKDEIKLGHETAEGLITEITIEEGERLRFNFPMDESHVLRVTCKPRWFGLGKRWLHLDK